MAECRLLTIHNRNWELKEKKEGSDNVRLILFLEMAQFFSLLAADPGSISQNGSKQPEMIPEHIQVWTWLNKQQQQNSKPTKKELHLIDG